MKAELVHQVFKQSEAGAKLLALWNEDMLHSQHKDLSPQALAYSAGRNDFVATLNARIAEVENNER